MGRGDSRYNIGMHDHPDACYQALLSRDARFDGVFFTGVSTTGIYCRPVCPVKPPRRTSCTFFPGAAAAEQAGFRPCLRCRPELAPGHAPMDAVGRLAAVAVSRIEAGALADGSLETLARALGVSDRHLRRSIASIYGVGPAQLVRTQRLLLAKRLLSDTGLPVTDIAYASGFASLRRFNTVFKEAYRMAPTRFRRTHSDAAPAPMLTCEVGYRPPLAWEPLLAFLGARAMRGVEDVEAGRYVRTVRLGEHRGWITVQPAARRTALAVTFSNSLVPVLAPVLARVKRQFDLAAAPDAIQAHLGDLVREPGLRVPGAFDGFQLALRAILGQQVSVAGASTLAGRLAEAFGEPFEGGPAGLSRLSPTPERLAEGGEAAIAAIGLPGARARAIHALAVAVSTGTLDLEPRPDPSAQVAQLETLPGVGAWTAQYIAMRAFAWPDAFPHSDLGLRKALGNASPLEVLQSAEAWRPWRAYAAMHLWHALEPTP